MRDENESQAIAPLPDAKRRSRAQIILINQAIREENLARTAIREAKELRQKADAKELEAQKVRFQAAELRAAARQLDEE